MTELTPADETAIEPHSDTPTDFDERLLQQIEVAITRSGELDDLIAINNTNLRSATLLLQIWSAIVLILLVNFLTPLKFTARLVELSELLNTYLFPILLLAGFTFVQLYVAFTGLQRQSRRLDRVYRRLQVALAEAEMFIGRREA